VAAASPITLVLDDEAATGRLGQDIALALRGGETLLLEGDLGAGKTALARAILRTLSSDLDLEVPSPTYTLVQVYELRLPVLHYDLYRLRSADELDELGFGETPGAVSLVEWPDRADGRLPAEAVTISLSHEGKGRRAVISGSSPAFMRIARSLALRSFMASSGWGDADRAPLTGDASARAYETVKLPGEPARLVVNSPPLVLGPPVRGGKPYAVIAHTAQTVAAFLGVARALRSHGITAPDVYDADLKQGFMMVEHLGHGAFLDADGMPVAARYSVAAELLDDIHAQDWPDEMPTGFGPSHRLPPFDRDAMLIETELLLDWYIPFVSGKPASDAVRADYLRIWNAALDRIADTETSLLLRDYHSPNIVWRPDCSGPHRLGVLDFQDAMRGPTAYDLASLAMDARVDVPAHIQSATLEAYCARRARRPRFDRNGFDLAFSTMAAQRNSKILGIFVRLDRRDGKPQYLKLLPRIRDYLGRALDHPALAEMRAFYAEQGFIGASS